MYNSIFLLFSLFLFETVGGVYLYLAYDATVFYQVSLLFHVFAGLLLIFPFAIFQFKHFLDIADAYHNWARIGGYLSFLALAAVCLTGSYLTFIGVRKDNYWVSDLHTWSGFMSAAILIFHLKVARRGSVKRDT